MEAALASVPWFPHSRSLRRAGAGADGGLDPGRVATLAADAEAHTKLTTQFMDQNIKFAHANFGSQADNMTAVLAYLTPL